MPTREGRRRLGSAEREQLIVQQAIRYFATHGFAASTRELAKELGISQPLLYRYFPSKEALAERVFKEVYLSRWNPEWDQLLADRSLALTERLHRFYRQYAGVILNSDWIRIFIQAGLSYEGINLRYLARLRERVFDVVLTELHREFAVAAPTPQQHEDEIEFIWGLHAAIFYIGVRKWVYRLGVPEELDRLVERQVEDFMASAPLVLRQLRQP
ncbi:TetR/AcrR family transcriptional regulator [Duganella aquatilis]|uniref:TetR/AcrR family transcriptional regulator n=1 Tax=Duganella aquatilis TaxID=2666082 RepID=UPI001E60BDCF|nr:TetR/AcrR family transcriptional regulator [Duganella aquatilis]